MKRIMIMVLISLGFLGGCKKDSGYVAVSPTINNQNSSINIPRSAVINYNMNTALPAGNELFQWKQGFITIGEITFDGFLINNGIAQEHDRIIVNRLISLMQPSSAGNVTMLGNVNLPFGVYNEPAFGVVMGIIPTPIMPSNSRSAMVLSGNCVANNRDVPVVLQISQITGLTAMLANPIKLDVSQQSYPAVLYLTFDQLTTGIGPDMLNNAVLTNDTLLITASINPVLYQVMLGNFQKSSLKVQFGAIVQPPEVTPSGATLSAPPPTY